MTSTFSPDTFLVYCCRDTQSSHFAQRKDALVAYDRTHDNRIADIYGMISSPLIAASRNHLVDTFLNSDATWLFMLDDDIAMPSDSLDRLLAIADDDHPIVSGLYFGGRSEGYAVPHAYTWDNDTQGWHPIEGAPLEGVNVAKGGNRWGARGLVDAVGAGFFVCHRKVYERLRELYKDTGFSYFADGSHMGEMVGEDMVFCLRARKEGYRIVCDTSLIAGHVKPGIVDEQTYEAYLAQTRIYGEKAESIAGLEYQSRFRHIDKREVERAKAHVIRERVASNEPSPNRSARRRAEKAKVS